MHKSKVDMVHKDRKHKLYPANFRLSLMFHERNLKLEALPSPRLPPQTLSTLPGTHSSESGSRTSVAGNLIMSKREWFESVIHSRGTPWRYRCGAAIEPHRHGQSFFYVTRGAVEVRVRERV